MACSTLSNYAAATLSQTAAIRQSRGLNSSSCGQLKLTNLNCSYGGGSSISTCKKVALPAVVCAASGDGGSGNQVQVEQGGSGKSGQLQSQNGSKETEFQQQKRQGGGGSMMRRRRQDSPLVLFDYWDPFSAGGLRQMMDMVDQLFFDLLPGSGVGGAGAGAGAGAGSVGRSPWDVAEDEQGYYVRVDMPGFSKEDVKVRVEDGVLVIEGERDPAKEDQRWAAKSYAKFNTRLALPDNAHHDKISAELKDGVLCITLPKTRPDDKKHVIDVQVS